MNVKGEEMDQVTLKNFSSDNTVDRTKETKLILTEIEEGTANIICLASKTGIGKSTLAKKILKQVSGFIPIRVRTNPENISESVTEGLFLSKIFDTLVNYFEKNNDDFPICSFASYLRSNRDGGVKRESWENLINEITGDNTLQDAGISLSQYLLSRIFNLNEYNPDHKITLCDKDSMLLAHRYIKFVLKQAPLLINIDNIQNIDSYSRQFFLDWSFSCERNSVFLLEYTISEKNNQEKLLSLLHEFEDADLNVKLLQLSPLDSENALNAVKNIHRTTEDNSQAFFEAAQNFYIFHSKGNMQKLIDYTLQYSENSLLKKCYDPTLERIKLLNDSKQFILAIIILHGGEIDAWTLEYIVKTSTMPYIFSYESLIEDMDSVDHIVTIKDDIVSIQHASTIDSWNNHSEIFDKYNLLAYSLCEKYYLNFIHNKTKVIYKQNVNQAMLFLLKVYSKYEKNKLENLISNINSMVSDQITPEHVWEYYLIFLDYIKGKENEHISSLYDMILFCFNHALYKNCLYIIELIEKYADVANQDFLFVYKINCFEYLEVQEATAICQQRLSKTTDYGQLYNLYLLLMGRYRSINNMEKVLFYKNKILEIPDYDKMTQYGIFLRLSEIYMRRDDALPFVKKSVEFFETSGNQYMEAKSRLTYFFLLALTSDLKFATDELHRCKNLVAEMHYWDGILALNEASLLLLQKQYGGKVDSLLSIAELTINGSFDLLLTLSMKLINQYETTHACVDKILLKQIESLLVNETDQHLICLTAYNLYLYFEKIGNSKEAMKYRCLATDTQKHNITVAFRLAKQVNPRTPNLFLTDWCVGFTFFWNVDVPKPEA